MSCVVEKQEDGGHEARPMMETTARTLPRVLDVDGGTRSEIERVNAQPPRCPLPRKKTLDEDGRAVPGLPY